MKFFFFFSTHFQTSFFTLWNLTQCLNMKISKIFGTTCHICSIKHKCWMKEKKQHSLHFCDSKSHLKNILHVLFCIIVKHTFNCTPFKNPHWLLFAMWIFEVCALILDYTGSLVFFFCSCFFVFSFLITQLSDKSWHVCSKFPDSFW